MTSIFFGQSIIKQLSDSAFLISRVINVLVRVMSLKFRLRLITLTSTLSNNGNRTEWSPIRYVVIHVRVITKSDNRPAGVRFVYHEYVYRLNWAKS